MCSINERLGHLCAVLSPLQYPGEDFIPLDDCWLLDVLDSKIQEQRYIRDQQEEAEEEQNQRRREQLEPPVQSRDQHQPADPGFRSL